MKSTGNAECSNIQQGEIILDFQVSESVASQVAWEGSECMRECFVCMHCGGSFEQADLEGFLGDPWRTDGSQLGRCTSPKLEES